MVLQALFLSEDDQASEALSSVLSGVGMAVQQSGYPHGVFSLPEEKPDAIIVDFDDLEQALAIVRKVCAASLSPVPVIVALLKDQSQVRRIFAAGGNFIVYKPISEKHAKATLRAATALIKRERRRRFRVPVQAPVQVTLDKGVRREGIILDLSEGGMDIIMAEGIPPSSKLKARVNLPNGFGEMVFSGEVAWGNPNGQCGVRFTTLAPDVRDKLVEWVDVHAQDLIPEDPGFLEGKLSDLSLGGCYVETESPFPEHSVVELRVKLDKIEVAAKGTVRVMHPGHGMGIEFASETQAQHQDVANLLRVLRSNGSLQPQLKVAPVAFGGGKHADHPLVDHPAIDHPDDPLLHLIKNHESLTHEEFLQELCEQRSS